MSNYQTILLLCRARLSVLVFAAALVVGFGVLGFAQVWSFEGVVFCIAVSSALAGAAHWLRPEEFSLGGIRELSSSASWLSGEEYYEKLCQHLAGEFDMDLVLVGEVSADGLSVDVRMLCSRDEKLELFSYELAGSPCSTVIGHEVQCYESGVQETFPEDELLATLGIVSYVGASLCDRLGNEIGVLVMLSKKPFRRKKQCLPVMRKYSERVSVEMDRMHVVSSLRESEARFRSLFEGTNDSITVLDDQSHVVIINAAGARLGNQDKTKLVGRHISEACPSHYEVIIERAERTRRDKKSFEYEDMVEIDDAPRWFRCSYHLIKGHRAGQSFVMEIARDITESKSAELERKTVEDDLKFALQAAQMGRWSLDAKTGNVSWSGQTERIFGLKQGGFEGSLGDVFKRIHVDDAPKVKKAIKAAFARTGGDYYDVVYRINTKQGGPRWVNSKGMVLRNHRGEAVKMSGTVVDVTDWKKAEADLHAEKEHALESDRLKSAFLANMSHEIRTPLNGIMGFAQLLKSEAYREEQERDKFLDVILSNGNHLLRLISDLIDIARIESNELTVVVEPFDLNVEMLKVYSNFSHEAYVSSSGQAKLVLDNSGTIETNIIADETRLRQVLYNLLLNAFKFTQKGEIRFGYRVLDHDYIEFHVSDTGTGISREDRERIFNRFIQADSAITRRYDGAGLGLAISKGLVELMGGKIWVKSNSVGGSTFYFTIRAQQTFETNPPRMLDQQYDNRVLKTTVGNSSSVVLVVDDLEENFRLIEQMLDAQSVEVVWAENGFMAVEMIEQRADITLVLMDMKMPKMNGLEATKKIVEMRPDLSIAMQSACVLDADKKNAFAAGCTAFLTKPIIRQELLELVRDYADQRKS